MNWEKIDSAPKDGRKYRFLNIDNGLEDTAAWSDYSREPEECRESWPDEIQRDLGEWNSDHGNFPMTHWCHFPPATEGEA